MQFVNKLSQGKWRRGEGRTVIFSGMNDYPVKIFD